MFAGVRMAALCGAVQSSASPVAPPGYVLIVDNDASFIVDSDGSYLIEVAP